MLRPPPRSTPFPTRRSSDLPPEQNHRRQKSYCNRRDSFANEGRRCRMLRPRAFRVRLDVPSGNLSIGREMLAEDRKSTRLNSSHTVISYAVFCLKKKKTKNN